MLAAGRFGMKQEFDTKCTLSRAPFCGVRGAICRSMILIGETFPWYLVCFIETVEAVL